MRVCLFNANGLSGKFDRVKDFSDKLNIDLLFIVETYLIDGKRLGNPLFSLHKSVGDAIAGGRRANGGITAYAPAADVYSEVEICFLDAHSNGAIIKISSLYIGIGYFPPPREYDSKMIDFLEKGLSVANGGQLLLLGDFNARSRAISGDHATKRRGRMLEAFLEINGNVKYQTPSEGKFTSFSNSGAGITDMIFAVNGCEVKNLIVHSTNSLGGSDHRPLTLDVELSLAQPLAPKHFQRLAIRKLIQLDVRASYLEHLERGLGALLTGIEAAEDINVKWELTKEWINTAAFAACGKVHYKRWGRDSSFINGTLQRSIDHIYVLEERRAAVRERSGNRRIKERQLCLLGAQLKEAHRFHEILLKSRKRQLFEEAVDNLGVPQNAAAFTRMVSGANKRRTRGASALSTSKLDLYAEHFASTFGREVRQDAQFDQVWAVPLTPRAPLSEELIKDELKNTPLGKAPGIDGVHGECLYYGGAPMTTVIRILFSDIYAKARIPKEWKRALICPGFKNKGNKNDIINYRPIALTCVVRRLYERVVRRDLSEEIKMLHPCQGGFRARRSTMDQCFLLDEIYRTHPGLHAVYLDLKAAYDLADRRVLWKRLATKYRLNKNTLSRLMDLFEGVSSFLVINGKRSKEILHQRGLLQGSSLSPILFNFFINELLEILDTYPKVTTLGLSTNALLFADDASLHAESAGTLQVLLTAAQNWSVRVGMEFSPDKCVHVPPAGNGNVEMRLYGQVLKSKEEATYLGIKMTAQGIDWEACADDRASKTARAIELFGSTGMNATGWAPASSVQVYKSFIRPKMEYGMALRPMNELYLDRMERIQNSAMRKILGAPKNTSIGAMRKLLQLPTMQHRNNLLNIQQAARWHNSTDRDRPAVVLWRNKLQTRSRSRLNPEYESSVALTVRKNPLWGKVKLRNHVFTRLSAPNAEGLVQEVVAAEELWPKGLKAKAAYKSIMESASGAVAQSFLYEQGDPIRALLKPGVKRKQRITLIRWMLGLVCQHQICVACGEELSRAHGTECCRTLDFLAEKYPDILEGSNEHANIIDAILNKHRKTRNPRALEAMEASIAEILQRCRGLVQEDNYYWRPPGNNEAQPAFWPRGAQVNVEINQVANPAQTAARNQIRIDRNRRIGRPSRAFHRRLNDTRSGTRSGIG
jgi:hypothetical protein